MWSQHIDPWYSEADRWEGLLKRRIGLGTRYTDYIPKHRKRQGTSGSNTGEEVRPERKLANLSKEEEC